MYEELNAEKPCYKCIYEEYVDEADLHLCGHRPLPENLGVWTEIDLKGTCEYWELNRFYFEGKIIDRS